MKTFFLFVMCTFLVFSNAAALETVSPGNDQSKPALIEPQQVPGPEETSRISTLTEEETILLNAPQTERETFDHKMHYFAKAGAIFAIHDDTFRDFLDYGPAISAGIEREMNEKLSLRFSIGFEVLKGEWSIAGNRESIFLAGEEYYPGFVPGPGETLTAEDLPDVNAGTSIIIHAEGIVTSSESLQRIDADTTLYLLPLTINAKYWLHKDKKVNPYVGGGIGFCYARRDVDSSAVKEKFFNGPEYLIELTETQYTFGPVLNFVAGIEIPLKNNMRIFAEANTAIYDLKRLDPIFEISYKQTDPGWYGGSFISSWSNENPVEIGVFNYEIASSVMIGLVVPF